MKLRSLLPLLLFIGLTALLAIGLGLDPRELPSPLLR
ncbi:DsbE family thiol:disulfide interchange protein, partial [Achromobacter xylosoxidans]|nr:DsbE family thiol:disulfide interchange protein [Achromobacter xylosoxidans]